MRVYVIDDGRTNYAVAAKNIPAAIKAIAASGRHFTRHNFRQYGYTYEFGELVDLATVERSPGVVFRSPIIMRESDQWEPVRPMTTPSEALADVARDIANPIVRDIALAQGTSQHAVESARRAKRAVKRLAKEIAAFRSSPAPSGGGRR